MKRLHRVMWALDVEAETAEDAAREALREVRDASPGGPTVFTVLGPGRDDVTTIDVEDLFPAPPTPGLAAARRCSCCPRIYPRCMRRDPYPRELLQVVDAEVRKTVAKPS